MERVITFGEIMLRLAPPGCGRFVQTDSYGATYGGGEANVAVSLANFGLDAAFVTKLPAHEIGQAAVNSLRRFGVDTSRVVRGGSRKNLWTRARAGEVMAKICPHVDVCIANEEDAADVFGIHAEGTDVATGRIRGEGYEGVARALSQRFGFREVAITLRESISANDNNWAAMLYAGGAAYFSRKYAMRIVDRVGGGDSFAAGLIYGSVKGLPIQDKLEFAVAASCLKHSIEGDFNQVSVDEVTKLAGGDASGRVQR